MYGFLLYDETEIQSGRKLVRVEPYIRIHVKQVESLFKEHYHIEQKKDFHNYTVGGSVFVLAHPENSEYCKRANGTLKYYVAQETDVNPVLERLIQIYHEFAKPYFYKYGSVAGADLALNTNPDKWCTHNLMGAHRMMKGLIAAKLVHSPNYSELKSIYDVNIQRADHQNQTSYELIKDYLDKLL
jgi:hypothetical protein